jgi:hypothetical protein
MVAMHSKWHQTGNSLRCASEEQEMKRLKRALFSRDADATHSLWRNMDLRQPGSKAAARHAIRIHARK